jgi:pyruvate/2-oxoglutarate dehydrogenase complex dihydrolipoamide dehydrogenase (E3) component
VGSAPVMPPIPGIENAVDALTLYDHLDTVGKRVVVIGGGLAGCETGLNLAATGHEVTVIEMQERMAPETFSMPRAALLNEMEKQGIRQVLGQRCTEIFAGGAKLVDGAGNEEVIEADTVCVCIGMKSCSAAVATLKAAVALDVPVFEVGDCNTVGKVVSATESAYRAALAIV